ncbi:hypothetical protein D3C71_1895640 [compost metagenome]
MGRGLQLSRLRDEGHMTVIANPWAWLMRQAEAFHAVMIRAEPPAAAGFGGLKRPSVHREGQ